MTQTIPVSQIVTVNPAVVDAGGNPLSLNAVFVSKSITIPTSSPLPFFSGADAVSYFGAGSDEANLATVYFAGFDNSTKKPGTLYFAGYANSARAAWVLGQSIAGKTLDALKQINGSMSITVNGTVKSGIVNLASATSFTDATAIISTALSLTGVAQIAWAANQSRYLITTVGTGATNTITFASGPAAEALGLTSGIITNGADTDTPASVMERVKLQSQDWATFMTTYEPSLADKTAYAVWTNGQNNRYAYCAWDTDPGYATASNPAVFGTVVDTLNYEGVVVIYGSSSLAAFFCGYAGSIDFQAVNGRATAAFKSQSGLQTSVDNLPLANAVLSNNASYYGLYQARGQGNIYSILYDGRMNGSKFRWSDTYLNQVYLNAQLELSIFVGLQSVNSAPYDSLGETFIRAWCGDPIREALNNGTIRVGVPLGLSQSAAIAAQAGLDITNELQTQGFYLQVLPATAQVRQARQSPPVKLWYCDGGSIQQINMASIAVL